MTDRQVYYKNYYQNNKDKYKTNYRQVKYCNLCEKEFVNITRHKTTQLHKFMVKKFPNILEVGVSPVGNVLPLTNEPVSVPSVM